MFSKSEPQLGNITNTTSFKFLVSQTVLDLRQLQIIVFSLILPVSVFGNLMIVAIGKRNSNKQMKTSHNYLIVSLSVSNLMITVSCLPVFLVAGVYGTPEWKVPATAGQVLCKTGSFLADQTIAASSLTTIVISIDWFLCVFQPFKRHLNGMIARVGMVISWLVSTAYAGPILYEAHIKTLFGKVKVCNKGVLFTEQWIYTKVILTGALPLFVVITLNTAVVLKLWCRRYPGHTVSNRRRRATQRANQKGFKLPLVIIVVFYLSFLPYWINFVSTFVLHSRTISHNVAFQVAAQLLAYSSSAITPCILLSLGSRYRAGLITIIKSLQCCCHIRVHPTGPSRD